MLYLVAGEALGRYVPQAVCKDNTVLDVDLVLGEVAADGDELLVEYSEGPIAFKARYWHTPTVCHIRQGCAQSNRMAAPDSHATDLLSRTTS
jgi:hypothetical protein